jgi:hypothetical protein
MSLIIGDRRLKDKFSYITEESKLIVIETRTPSESITKLPEPIITSVSIENAASGSITMK